MGDVYRARDSELKRDVAIKVLPDAFSKDPERVARFRREAEVLASLNHPNIAAIYDLETSGELRCLVLELVEGETLADRLKRGPVPMDEALLLAKQIAEALEAAHEKGIIHRDLKPANIKLTDAGAVKVLDFGLAKALEMDGAAVSPDAPTVKMTATRPGMILGTPAYMSPEQAKGQDVDHRTDIFAFGSVLYEMLTGRRSFPGEGVSDILASVLKSEPNWDHLPKDTPAAIRRVLRRCLRKDRNRRLQTAGDARIEIEEAGAEPEEAKHVSAPAGLQRREVLAWIAAGTCAAAASAIGVLHFREKPPPADVTRFEILWPENTTDGNSFALSPDGRTLAFSAVGKDGRTQIWLRPMDSSEARMLNGTEGVGTPIFWSPDSRSLMFSGPPPLAALMRIDLAGGSARALCPTTAGPPTGTWTPDNMILFRGPSGLEQVEAGGGICSTLVARDVKRGELRTTSPSMLPDGKHFLYLRIFEQKSEDNGVYVGSLDAKPDQQGSKRLLGGSFAAQFVPSSGSNRLGHIAFVRDGTLFVQEFDPDSLSMGEAIPLVEASSISGGEQPLISFSRTGALVYRVSGRAGLRELRWYDRAGKAIGSVDQPGGYSTLSLSRDGKRVAFQSNTGNSEVNQDIWIHDFSSRTTNRLTTDRELETAPIWSTDGTRIAYAAARNGKQDVYQKLADFTGDEQLLVKAKGVAYPLDWSRDGRFFLYAEQGGPASGDLWVLPLEPGAQPKPLLATQFMEMQARFSPDGKFIVYVSNETGPFEVYVRPFFADGTLGGQQMVSQGGGTQPRWPAGKELYYLRPDGHMMAVPITTAPIFTRGTPEDLFPTSIYAGANARFVHYWDVTPEGRFLINTVRTDTKSPPFNVVLNWRELLKKQ
jgi:serine/threonine protein kinase/Tol biopolymer transport system component